MTTRFIRITKKYEGEKFFTVENGKRAGTLLLLVLIVINVADLVFAVDSIPAIFGITTDTIYRLHVEYFRYSRLADILFSARRFGGKISFSQIRSGIRPEFYRLKNAFATGCRRFTGIPAQTECSFSRLFAKIFASRFNQEVINISLGIVVCALLFR